MPKHARRWAAPALLFIIVALFYWKLVLTHQYTWLDAPDTANQVLPWLQFQAGEWHAGHFPLWDPNMWGGQPLVGQAQPGAVYPPNWLLFLMPLKQGWLRQEILHWYFVLIHFFAALTCYALCRDLRRSRSASIIAGCVFALGGYVGNTDWPQMINGAVWAPLVLLFLFRAERGEKPVASAILSGFFLGFAWLAGHHQMNIFVSIAVVGLWIWLALRNGRIDWRIAKLAALALLVAVFASALQTLPTAEYGRLAVRWSGAQEPLRFEETIPYYVHQEYAMKPIALLGVFIPGVELRSNPYVGIVAFTLALLGVALAWRRSMYVRGLAVMALCGILFGLGPNSLLHGVFYALIPLVEKARVPGAGNIVFALGLAPLVAFALDRLRDLDPDTWVRRAVRTLLAIAGLLAVASLIFFLVKLPSDDRVMITALAATVAAGILAAWRARILTPRTASAALLALILFELANVTTYLLAGTVKPADSRYLRRMSEHFDLVRYVRERGEAGRVEYDHEEIPYNIGDWAGIETFNGYAASVTANMWRNDVFASRVQDLLGIKYYFGKTPLRPEQKMVFEGRGGVKVFENLNAFPRVWAVHRAFTLPEGQAARSTLSSEGFDARGQVFLVDKDPPRLATCDALEDEVDMPVHQAHRVSIRAKLGCRGMVILSDTWFPGWRATVDGRSAEIYEAYGMLRGVVVEAGEHTIEMRYRPASVLIGGAMTLLAALAAVVAHRRGR